MPGARTHTSTRAHMQLLRRVGPRRQGVNSIKNRRLIITLCTAAAGRRDVLWSCVSRERFSVLLRLPARSSNTVYTWYKNTRTGGRVTFVPTRGLGARRHVYESNYTTSLPRRPITSSRGFINVHYGTHARAPVIIFHR